MALSQVGGTWPVEGRQVGILVGSDTDADQLTTLISRIDAEDMVPLVIAPQGGEVAPGVVAHRTLLTARSIEFDAVVVTTAGHPPTRWPQAWTRRPVRPARATWTPA